MPDEPGKGPPPSARLSVEAADRLAENFTSIWDVDGDSVPAVVPAAPIAVSKPVTRHITLPGINPLDFADPAPSVSPPTAAVAPVPPSVAPPFVAPKPEPAPSAAVTQPMPVASSAQAPPAPQSEVHLPDSLGAASTEALPGSVDPTTFPSPSSPTRQVPGYAVAYTPKDGPGTPAVVIAPEAQSSPENARPFSLTIPARGRAVEAAPPPAPIAVADLSSFPPPKKGSGKRISALVAGAILLAAGVLLGVRALSGSGAPERGAGAPPASPSRAAAESVALPAPPPLSPTAASNLLPQPQGSHAASLAKSAPVPDPKAARTSTESKRISTATELKKATPARTRAAPVAASPTRAAGRPASATPLPPSSPGAASKPAPGKAVIVRDTPF